MNLRISSVDLVGKIFFLRGEKVLLDADLCKLYGIETAELKRAVRRNLPRFPKDFMFVVSKEELENLRCQIGTSRYSWGGARYLPMAFTEHGVAMLSSELHNPRAIQVNIAIIRTFVALRRMMQSNKELAQKIKQLESKYDAQFKVVFDAIRQLIHGETKRRRPIGFRVSNEMLETSSKPVTVG